ncbi:MAG: hypothetical protein JRH08_18695 [Deltaproteobacteria bacterium]|nr:hypothetical protein [Deltaproteobacteria bacterium]
MTREERLTYWQSIIGEEGEALGVCQRWTWATPLAVYDFSLDFPGDYRGYVPA